MNSYVNGLENYEKSQKKVLIMYSPGLEQKMVELPNTYHMLLGNFFYFQYCHCWCSLSNIIAAKFEKNSIKHVLYFGFPEQHNAKTNLL